MTDAAIVLYVLLGALAVAAMLALFIGSIVLLVKLTRLFGPDVERGRPRSRAVSVADRPAGGETHAAQGAIAALRYRELLELDLEPVTAAGAALAGVDPASVRSLVDHGCPPALALSIVAPDD